MLNSSILIPRKLASLLDFLGAMSQAILLKRLRSRALDVNKTRTLAEDASWQVIKYCLFRTNILG